MAERHDTRGRRVLGLGGLALGLCVMVLVVPEPWLERFATLFGVADETSAFTREVAALDTALEAGDSGNDLALLPYVAARRLTRAGPMTAEEVDAAALTLRDAMRTGDVLAFEEAERLLIERLPRLDPAKVRSELAKFREQVRATQPGGSVSDNCASCHRETMVLPGKHRFDLAGIYPFAVDAPEFESGLRVPLMCESIELDARKARLGSEESLSAASCGTCHVPHGAANFEVDRAARIENMGLWVNVIESDPGVLHIEAKVKNSASGHLAPAGRISPAYVVTVDARQGEQRLGQRYGRQLPSHLQRDGRTAGVVFARDYRDERGRRTTDPKRIADLVADNRLQSGRFSQTDFVFDRVDESVAQLEVTLWHLPDVMSWKGAKAIRRAAKSE